MHLQTTDLLDSSLLHFALVFLSSSELLSAMTLRGKIDPLVVQAAFQQGDIAAELLKELQSILLSDRENLFEHPITIKMKKTVV